MRIILSVLALAWSHLSLSAASESDFSLEKDILNSEKPVKVAVDPSGWYRKKAPPNGFNDPIQIPDLPVLSGKPLDAKAIKAFSDTYVAAIEKHYAADIPADLAKWFAANPDIRKDFLLALSPQFDEIKNAFEVFNALRIHDEKALIKFHHLAIALAVVFDSPEAPATSRFNTLWGVTEAQFSPQRPYISTFNYFTDKANLSRFIFKPDQLPWPILVQLVDFDVSDEEVVWAWKNCEGARKDIASLYQTVPYDNEKLARRTPKLGTSAYTLENLRHKGGVCVDQAHYTSRVAKVFGVPSMKVSGEGRYGASSRHAWSGFLVNAKGRAQLDFTGRYQGDYYYTGDIFDPQTRTMILDREVAMLYDGMSVSFFRYQESSILSRAALQLVNSDVKKSMAMAQQAIEKNTFNPIAWRLLAYGVSVGAIEPKEGNNLVTRLMKDLAGHPDLTLACLKRFMSAIPEKETAARQKIFHKAYALYDKRPDLQITLRLMQCEELVAASQQAEALQISLQTCTSNAKEGSLILPLIAYVVEFSQAFAASNPKFQLGVVKQALSAIEKEFPQKRGDEVSAAYLEFKQMVEKL
jgi:hypothetical protein